MSGVPNSKRTVVVGGGVIGLACAYELARLGEAVVVVDKGRSGMACSEGNAGWIVPSVSDPLPAPGLVLTSLRWMLSRDSPLYIAPRAAPGLARFLWRFWRHCNARDFTAGFHAVATLNRLTLTLFDRLAADGLPIELHRDGLLYVFRQRELLDKALGLFDVLSQYGYERPKVIPGDGLRELEPALSRDVTAGYFLRQEYHVRPETLSRAYVARIRELGGEVREGVAVIGAAHDNGRLTGVETEGETIPADRVLLAAGAWTGQVARRFGLRLPVEAGKGYSLTVDAPPAFRRPLYLGDVKVGSTPFDGAYRFAGTMELSGVNDRFDRRRLAAIRRAIGRYFREPIAEGAAAEWMGMRPLTPDGLPMLGQAGPGNLFVATGHAMLGITLAPATGVAMSRLMTGRPVGTPLEAFSPTRFRW